MFRVISLNYDDQATFHEVSSFAGAAEAFVNGGDPEDIEHVVVINVITHEAHVFQWLNGVMLQLS